MQDDNSQDFFEFDENFRESLENQHSHHPRPRRGRTLAVVVICAAVIAAVATVLGIFRSDDSTLTPNLAQTFPIKTPPPVSVAATAPTSTPEPASAGTAANVPAPDSAAPVETIPEAPRSADTGGQTKNENLSVGVTTSAPVQTPAPEPATKQEDPPPVSQRPGTFTAIEPTPSPPKPPADKTRLWENRLSAGNGLPDLTGEIRAGRLQQAAQVYRRYFRNHPAKYSISLEVACQPQTVMRAFSEVDPAGKMFILPARLGERSCFAVLWGTYRTIREAKDGKASVPSFFTSQTTPRIVGLFRYME